MAFEHYDWLAIAFVANRAACAATGKRNLHGRFVASVLSRTIGRERSSGSIIVVRVPLSDARIARRSLYGRVGCDMLWVSRCSCSAFALFTFKAPGSAFPVSSTSTQRP